MRKLPLVVLAVCVSCTPDLPRDEPGNYVVAIFDPSAEVPVVPTPSDLAVNAETGLLEITDAPNASLAEQEFNAYLRTLDGFPVEATATAPFSAAIDPASVTAETVRVLDVTDPDNVTPLSATELKFDAARKQLSVKAPWQRARQYAIALLGGDMGIRGANGETVVGSPALLLVRSQRSLLSCDDVNDPNCKPTSSLITGETEAERRDKGVKLERYRRVLAPAVAYLSSNGIQDWQLAGLWGFRTVRQPLATFDPKNKIIPFPNDLLMANGKVNLPADPDDDAQTAATKQKLNELDGFSTTASILTEFGSDTGAADARLDAATIFPGSFLVLNLDDPAELVEIQVRCRSCGNGGTPPGTEPDQLALIPSMPLRSHTRYAVYWFRSAREYGGEALANTGSIFALMRVRTPLFENNASTIPTVDPVTAALLEPLRVQTQELLVYTDNRRIPREDILLAWSFTTQTTTQPLAELRHKPAEWNLSTATTNAPTAVDYSLLAQLAGVPPYLNWHSQIRSIHEVSIPSGLALTPDTEIDPVTGASQVTDGAFSEGTLTTPRPETLRVLIAMPVTPKFPDGRIPVVIFQHGLGGHRRNAALIANTIAKKGYATVAIDAPFHGERSYCRLDTHCVMGSCTNNRCPGGYAASDVYTGTPDISGVGFASSTNPFATRDHFRQQIIDLAQLIRSLKNTTDGLGALSIIDDPGTSNRTERLDAANIRYIGQSLGGIIGTMALAAIPEISAATLNVPGADPVLVTQTSPGFSAQKQQLDAYLAGKGIPTGSQKYEEFMDTARWILDPADPQNYGRHLITEPLIDVTTNMPGPRKRPFVSWVQGDSVVPNPATQLLIRSITLDPAPTNFTQTQYQGGDHIFLLNLVQGGSLALAAQTDAMNWVDR